MLSFDFVLFCFVFFFLFLFLFFFVCLLPFAIDFILNIDQEHRNLFVVDISV